VLVFWQMRKRCSEPRIGPTGQKVMLLLLGGLSLGLTHSPRQYFRIARTIGEEWERIERRALHNAIKSLYKSRLLGAKDNPDGTTSLVLSKQGKKKALTYQIDEIKIPRMKKWDGKWRIALFDIPEKRKKERNALRTYPNNPAWPYVMYAQERCNSAR